MPPVKRIVLVDGSRLLRGMLKRAIERELQLYVVAEVDELNKIPSVIQHAQADWIFLIIPPGNAIPEIVQQTLREHPELILLVMSTDGSRVRMRWIETHETSLDQKNLKEIMTILRETGNKINQEKGSVTNGYAPPREIARVVN